MAIKSLVFQAYHKLKANIYSDNTNMFLRSKLAEFEADSKFEEKLDLFTKQILLLKRNGQAEPYFQELIEQIKFIAIPKRIAPTPSQANQPIMLTNDPALKKYRISKPMLTIDCPIEIHLISVMWVMKLGKDLDSQIDDNLVYGNRLQKGELDEHDDNQRKLFVPYFQNYRRWRDNGLEVAKELHRKQISSTMLTLDIKNYYYSVDLDLEDLNEAFHEADDHLFLNTLLNRIHKQYKQVVNAKNNLLPIGLLSSGVLANYILLESDQAICRDVKPAYFGRYVDDFIIVLPHTTISSGADIKQELIKRLKIYPIFEVTDDNKAELKIRNSHGNFIIQVEKIRIINLNWEQPLSILEEFERNIRETSSEARLLVENADLLSTFDSEASHLVYSDSVHKLRSVDAFNMNKLGASSYLTNLIEATKITLKVSKEDLNGFHASVTSYFRGAQGIESYNLWEKIITFYVIEGQNIYLFEFVKNLIDELIKIDTTSGIVLPFDALNPDIEPGNMAEMIRDNLIKWIIECLAIAFALHPKALLSKNFPEYITRILESQPSSLAAILKKITANLMAPKKLLLKSKNYRDSNLIRHKYVSIPLANYCKQAFGTSLTDPIPNSLNFSLDAKKIKYSPRFINLHEIQIFCLLRYLKIGFKRSTLPGAAHKFVKINRLTKRRKAILKSFPTQAAGKNLNIIRIPCEKNDHSEYIKLGIANIRIPTGDAVDAMMGSPNLHYDRLTRLNRILNQAVREKVQLMIFPEMTIPIYWVDYLARFAQKHNIGIISGLEHYVTTEQQVTNLVCHILPFKSEEFNNACILFRNKQDYSPEEMRWLSDLKLKTYDKLSELELVDWCGLHFITFNCFEVTDLKKRSLVAGDIDLLNIVENNRDTDYFSNIVESTSRDIHAIVAQVNNSTYGDSRVCLPAKSIYKDQLRIRGGNNPIVLVEDINIYELRLFQQIGASAEQVSANSSRYKPLPPNYEMLKSRRLTRTSKRRKSTG